MADDIQDNLKTYKLQLQQVEASLTTDPDNAELKKLREDLQEVIGLTQELISGKTASAAAGEASTSAADSEEPGEGSSQSGPPSHDWSVGDTCMAPYSADGILYEATIDEVLEDGSCTVTFSGYGDSDVTQIALLKPVDAKKRPGEGDDGPDSKRPKSKKDLMAEQREYKRKKNQKKAQRLKQLEEEREGEKNKWLDFNAKAFSKSLAKGRVKKSIFATPDNLNGKVGVGTCGISGRPMTAYQQQEKWKK